MSNCNIHIKTMRFMLGLVDQRPKTKCRESNNHQHIKQPPDCGQLIRFKPTTPNNSITFCHIQRAHPSLHVAACRPFSPNCPTVVQLDTKKNSHAYHALLSDVPWPRFALISSSKCPTSPSTRLKKHPATCVGVPLAGDLHKFINIIVGPKCRSVRVF